MLEVRTRPLFAMRLAVDDVVVVGETPAANRRIGLISAGRFEGDRLSGAVIGSGADWQSLRSDGAVSLDVRLQLKTDDGALIAMTYQGLRHGPREVIERLAKGEGVDPAAYYFRITAAFETASDVYGWMNRIVAIGTGHRLADGPIYNLFEVL
ncbi:MAG: DUF3237 domain-containing protein [Caulobacteraceae bacterium]|nr:DUF3237 domain-containing protein [Caulobacteraceae bacterium]